MELYSVPDLLPVGAMHPGQDSEGTTMTQTLRRVWLVLPWAILGCYGVLIADYGRYLDSSLRYVEPIYPRAPEDVLGLGFWPVWALVFCLLSVGGVLAYRHATTRPAYFLVLAAIFLIATASDYFLYQTLAQQVLEISGVSVNR